MHITKKFLKINFSSRHKLWYDTKHPIRWYIQCFSVGTYFYEKTTKLNTYLMNWGVWYINKTFFSKEKELVCFEITPLLADQGCHSDFEPSKVQYSTSNFFDQLFLIRVYWNPKSRQGPILGSLGCCDGTELFKYYSFKLGNLSCFKGQN